MIELREYGPVLDVFLDVMEEASSMGQADIYVPGKSREALGMAIDISKMFVALYPYTNVSLTYRGKKTGIESKDNKHGVSRWLELNYNIDDGNRFVVPHCDSFSRYPHSTIIDIKPGEKTVGYGTRISVSGKSIPDKHPPRIKSRFAGSLKNAGLEIPVPSGIMAVTFSYDTIAPYSVDMIYQSFQPVGVYIKERAHENRLYYPVSRSGLHQISQGAWELLKAPVFWTSWSQYTAEAINKMAGRRDTEPRNPVSTERMSRAELGAVDIIRTELDEMPLSSTCENFGCPPEYAGFYLYKALRTLKKFCNPGAFNDPARKPYIDKLARRCCELGLEVTSQELAYMGEQKPPANSFGGDFASKLEAAILGSKSNINGCR